MKLVVNFNHHNEIGEVLKLYRIVDPLGEIRLWPKAETGQKVRGKGKNVRRKCVIYPAFAQP